LPGWGDEILFACDHKRRCADPGEPIQRVGFFVGLPLLAGGADLRLGLRQQREQLLDCRFEFRAVEKLSLATERSRTRVA
jgi:hypothetical protein